jgi:hypothetical protein
LEGKGGKGRFTLQAVVTVIADWGKGTGGSDQRGEGKCLVLIPYPSIRVFVDELWKEATGGLAEEPA